MARPILTTLVLTAAGTLASLAGQLPSTQKAGPPPNKAASVNIKVVAVEYCLDNQEKAQAQVAAVLQKNPDLAGVFGVNVFSAQGAYRAVVNAGLTGAVKIATWDATQDLINALKKGEVDLVLAQMPAEIGSKAVEWGVKYLKKEVKEIPNKKDVPGFFVFTKENVDKPESQQYIYTK